jgi:hypothetical protein
MKNGKVFFHPIEGTGALTISWSSEPKGIAIEAKRGSGVGFFSKTGKLICVIFDEVREDHDHQTLEFSHDCVEVTVRNGRVRYTVNQRKAVARARRTAKSKCSS